MSSIQKTKKKGFEECEKLPDPDDEFDYLDCLSSSSALQQDQEQEQTVLHESKPSLEKDVEKSNGLEKNLKITNDETQVETSQYILGTLIVRVVAARNLLNPVKLKGDKKDSSGRNGGVKGLIFGGSSKGESINPFIRLGFESQLQRTSQMFHSCNPVFPRTEYSYFDVYLPIKTCTKKISNTNQTGTTENNLQDLENNDEQHVVTSYPKPPIPTLFIDVFHSENDKLGLNSNKSLSKGSKNKSKSLNEDPDLLGSAIIDLTTIITGKDRCIDTWIPIFFEQEQDMDNKNHNQSSASLNHYTGEVHIICEYEPTDPVPKPGDHVILIGYCNPYDLYPITTSVLSERSRSGNELNTNKSNIFLVEDVSGEVVYLTSLVDHDPYSWKIRFSVHVNMILCIHSHVTTVDHYKQQILDISSQLSVSPLAQTVNHVMNKKLPDEGLLNVGVEGAFHSVNLLNRWIGGGVSTVVNDIIHATNADGMHSVVKNDHEEESNSQNESLESDGEESEEDTFKTVGTKEDLEGPTNDDKKQPIPVDCPITGQPMFDPVVAGDGQTYERYAIEKWLLTSDKSPLTGQVMPHKELVPNYLLISMLKK